MIEVVWWLVGGVCDILEVVLSSGYGLYEVFMWVFGEQFGVSLMSVCECGFVDGLVLVELWCIVDGVVVVLEELCLVYDGVCLIVGFGCCYMLDIM